MAALSPFVHVDELGSVYRLLNGLLQVAPLPATGKFDLYDEQQWMPVEEVLLEHYELVRQVMVSLHGPTENLPQTTFSTQELLQYLADKALRMELRLHQRRENLPLLLRGRAVKPQEDGFGFVSEFGERLFVELPPSEGYTFDEVTSTTFCRNRKSVTIRLL